jgi:RHS repeat-associated protein
MRLGWSLRQGATTPTAKKYKYNSKELMNDFGLGLYDYGARMYDAASGRWNGVDALAERYAAWSGYNYVLGNPVRLVDKDGKAPTYEYPKDKAAEYQKNYPTLTKYLQKNVQRDIIRSDNIVAGLQKHSGNDLLTDKKIMEATTWGSGPTIQIVDAPGGLDGASGHYDFKTNTISLTTKAAKQLENASSQDKLAALFGMFITITHETVHYGDYLDGVRVDDGIEPGRNFADEVFYSQIMRDSEGAILMDGNRVITTYAGDGVNDSGTIEGSKKLMQINRDQNKEDVIPTLPE